MTYEACYLVGEMISSTSMIEGLVYFYNVQWGEISDEGHCGCHSYKGKESATER